MKENNTIAIKNELPELLEAVCLHSECPEWLREELFEAFNKRTGDVSWSAAYWQAQFESIKSARSGSSEEESMDAEKIGDTAPKGDAAPGKENKRDLDYYGGWEKIENRHKIDQFAMDLLMEDSPWVIDAILMICDTVIGLADLKDPHRSLSNIESLMNEIKSALFSKTLASDQCMDAYMDYLKKGVHDYRSDASSEMTSQCMSSMGEYLASHDQRMEDLDRRIEMRKEG